MRSTPTVSPFSLMVLVGEPQRGLLFSEVLGVPENVAVNREPVGAVVVHPYVVLACGNVDGDWLIVFLRQRVLFAILVG